MQMIKSRKHAQSRFNQQMSAALAVMLLPVAAHAADAGTDPVIVAGSNQTLQEVRVKGDVINDFKADKASSAKYTEKLVDTAQSLSVIKKELIEQQGAVTLTEALRNTPGVGAFFLGENGSTNTGDAIYMRGFDASASIYVDGVRDIGSISRDVFNIEQIDVLKGPAGTDNGRSSPTGSINLVSKQPQLQDAYSGSVTGGSGRQKRATADLDTVIDSASGTALRLNLLDQDSGNPARDKVNNKRWAVAPTLAVGLNTPTRLYLDYLHVKQNNVPDGGAMTIGLPGYSSPDPKRPFLAGAPAVDPKNFYGSTSDFDHVQADMVTVRVEHDFSPTLKLQNTSRYGKTTENYLLTSFTATAANLITPSAADPATWQLARTNLNIKDQRNEIVTNQSTLTADFATGAAKHTLVGGLELSNEKQTTYGYAATGTLPADTVKLGDRLIFNGGVRVDHYSTTYDAIALSTAAANPTLPVGTLIPTALDLSGKLVTGKLSALYKPTEDSSVYALFANSKQPPGGANFALSTSASSAANPKFTPEVTTTTELGSKWDLLQEKLSLTAALYRTEVKNDVEQDPVDLLYYQTGRKRVQGLELGLTGQLARDWLVSAGYALMDTRVEAGKVETSIGSTELAYAPKQTFTAWTSYTLPMGLKFGGGARYASKLLRGTDGAIGTPAYADAYWVVDAMAAYSIGKNVDLQLNLYNLADKTYVAAINKSGYRYTPGAPRSGSLTANFRF